MVRRAVGSEFMGNAFVFPGGSVDEGDGSVGAAEAVRWDGDPEELPWRAAALRELYEEAGLALTSPAGLHIASGADDPYRAVVAAGGVFDAGQLHWVSRWITPEVDNYGFARWVKDHEEELRTGLGAGLHFGEWWGQGIQRRYGQGR
ncbi:MAG: hypothetical protein MUP76_09000, partial [Acidimicrobiia bacterium]|nr:hypothetical protein [Acidimicrobiia bacterium]